MRYSPTIAEVLHLRLRLAVFLVLALQAPLSWSAGDGADHDHAEPAHRSQGHSARAKEDHPPRLETDQDAHDHDPEKAEEIHLSPEQVLTLSLEISELQPRILGETLRAPGEVRLNTYATVQVTPRIEAQVVARYARLGELVEQGQSLVSLSSVEMAEAHGFLIKIILTNVNPFRKVVFRAGAFQGFRVMN